MIEDRVELRPDDGTRTKRRPRRADLLGVAFIVLMSLLFLSPALKDGPSFGPADLGTTLSTLTSGALPLQTDCVAVTPPARPTCTHDNENGDQIEQGVPWTNEDWELVHHGEFPWWNDLGGTGLPQFLNFSAAPLALSSIVSYAFPLAWAFLVVVWMKLLICGLGAYVLARMLRCRASASALGATTAMLSGSFAGWLGWPQTATLCWSGFIAAGLLWCYREPRRSAPLALLALSVAFAIYGGFPEGYALFAAFFVLLIAGGGVAYLRARRRPDPRGLGRAALGVVLGGFLSAPLWLPGLSVLRASIHDNEVTARGLGLAGIPLLFTQGFDGLPLAGSAFFGSPATVPNYFETAAYLGVVAVVLALVALFVAHRRPAVLGLSLATLGSLLLVYRVGGDPGVVQRLVIDLGLGSVNLNRMLILVGFSVGILAAIGAEELAARLHHPAVRRSLAASLLLVGLAVVALAAQSVGGLPGEALALRRASLLWPVASMVLLVVLVLALSDRRLALPRWLGGGEPNRRGEWLVGAALLGQSAFLLFAGVGISSYSHVEFPRTGQISRLTALVGGRLVALDAGNSSVRQWLGTGFFPDMNLGYGLDELAVHDPTAPASLFESWPVPNSGQLENAVNVFAPSVDSVALAKDYGASFILVAQSQPIPVGTEPVARIGYRGGYDTLVAVPGSARFVATGADVRSARHPGDATYRVAVSNARAGAVLLAHVTWSPGWSASVDGRAATLSHAGTAFMRVALPPGASEVTFTYRPPHLDLAVALVIVAVLAGLVDAAWGRRRRRAGEANLARG